MVEEIQSKNKETVTAEQDDGFTAVVFFIGAVVGGFLWHFIKVEDLMDLGFFFIALGLITSFLMSIYKGFKDKQ